MNRTITVTGKGHVPAKVDYVELTMSLESLHVQYEQAMEIAANNISQLELSLVAEGFERDSLKTRLYLKILI